MPEDDPCIIFLSSSLNNMLVCGLLKGMNLALNQFTYDPTAAFSAIEFHDIEFDSIEIMDPRIF